MNNDLVWLFGIGKQAFIIRSHLERTKNLKEKNKKKCGQQATCSRKTMTAIAEKNSCTDGWRKVICGLSFTGSDKTGDLTLFKKSILYLKTTKWATHLPTCSNRECRDFSRAQLFGDLPHAEQFQGYICLLGKCNATEHKTISMTAQST